MTTGNVVFAPLRLAAGEGGGAGADLPAGGAEDAARPVRGEAQNLIHQKHTLDKLLAFDPRFVVCSCSNTLRPTFDWR